MHKWKIICSNWKSNKFISWEHKIPYYGLNKLRGTERILLQYKNITDIFGESQTSICLLKKKRPSQTLSEISHIH